MRGNDFAQLHFLTSIACYKAYWQVTCVLSLFLDLKVY